MEIAAFVFALFGLFAFIRQFELERSVRKLEHELSSLKGTSYHETRASLRQAARSYVGKAVKLKLKEDYQDVDVGYGNMKNGENLMVDIDEEWMLLRVTTPKGSKEKLIRVEAIEQLSAAAQ